MPGIAIDHSFASAWTAEPLAARPAILPRRHYTYPALVEEIERGALELMIRPDRGEPFLATCALGFASAAVPTGVWSCPDPAALCAVAGGYAYVIQTGDPARFVQISYRPVTAVLPLPAAGLLLFAGFHTVEAWGASGRIWQSAKLSWEGVRLGEATARQLHGWGWDIRTDRELEFVIDLNTGEHTGGPSFR